jgi:uncharacterized integral membrane protein
MQLRTLLLVLVLVLTAAFAAVNWSAFTATTALSLGFTVVEAPLGLIMLALTALIAVLFLVFIVYLQTGVLLEARRHARELEAQRQLADQAEASRFTELRAFLEKEIARFAAETDAMRADLRTAIDQSGNSLAAQLGELEDRLERRSTPAG